MCLLLSSQLFHLHLFLLCWEDGPVLPWVPIPLIALLRTSGSLASYLAPLALLHTSAWGLF